MTLALAVALLAAPADLPAAGVRVVRLPFDPESPLTAGSRPPGCTLAADGQVLLVQAVAGDGVRLAAVDLDAGRVTADRRVPGFARAVAVDARSVYLGMGPGDHLLVLDRQTLAEQAHVATPAAVKTLALEGGRLTAEFDSGRPPLTLTLPTLAPVEATPAEQLRAQPCRFTAVARLDDGSPDLSARANGNEAQLMRDLGHPQALYPVGRWGVWLGGSVMRGPGGRVIAAVPPAGDLQRRQVAPASAVLAGRPVAATAQVLGTPLADDPAARTRGPAYRVHAEVVYQDLVAGAAVARTRLTRPELFRPNGESYLRGASAQVFPRPDDRLAVLIGRDLYLVPPPAVPADLAPEPLWAPPTGRPVTVVADRPVPLDTPRPRGGRPPLVHSLAAPPPGVELDPATGAVTAADPGKLADWLLPIVTPLYVEKVRYRLAGTAGPGPDTLAEYVGQVAAGFERQTGRKPAGLPVFVRLQPVARDATLNTVPVYTGFFVDLPIERVRAAAEAEARKQIEAYKRQFPPARPVPPAGDPESLLVRVRALELRLDELNRKLDAVLKAVEANKPKDK